MDEVDLIYMSFECLEWAVYIVHCINVGEDTNGKFDDYSTQLKNL